VTRPSAADRNIDSSHRGVQRSISASASSKTRKTSTNVEPTSAAVGEFLLVVSVYAISLTPGSLT
jgi:hypothetical protein